MTWLENLILEGKKKTVHTDENLTREALARDLYLGYLILVQSGAAMDSPVEDTMEALYHLRLEASVFASQKISPSEAK